MQFPILDFGLLLNPSNETHSYQVHSLLYAAIHHSPEITINEVATGFDKAYTTFFCIQRWGWGWSAYTWYTH